MKLSGRVDPEHGQERLRPWTGQTGTHASTARRYQRWQPTRTQAITREGDGPWAGYLAAVALSH